MSLTNLGVVLNLVQGALYSEFGTPNNQGASLSMDMIRQALTRADLTGTAKVAMPALFDGTNDVDVSSAPCKLFAVVAQSLAAQSEDVGVLFYNTATPTEGTTRHLAATFVAAGGTAATAKLAVTIYPEPVPFDTAMSYSVVDNGANGDIETTGLGDASGARVMVIYSLD